MIPHLRPGGQFLYVPPAWDHPTGIRLMHRFNEGEHVYLRRFHGEDYQRPLPSVLVVKRVWHAPFFDYLLVRDDMCFYGRDEWLVTQDYLITEESDLYDL